MDSVGNAVIRWSWPEDDADIARLALAQYRRTPWPTDMWFPVAQEFLVYQRAGHVSACLGYRRDDDVVRVMHVWAEDGFSGRRGAVELMKSVERSADAEGLDLVFTARATNSGLVNAVKWHGCLAYPGEEPETVVYRRKAN
jgi:hypothetical protein